MTAIIRPRNMMRASRLVSFGISGWVESISLGPEGGGTFCLTIGCPDDFYAVRLGFANVLHQSWMLEKVVGCASTCFGDYVNPVGNRPWIPFSPHANGLNGLNNATVTPAPIIVAPNDPATFNGPAGTPEWTWTDWSPIANSTPDKATGQRVLMLRAFVPANQAICYSVGQMRTLTGTPEAHGGFDIFIGGLKFNKDRIKTISGDEIALRWSENTIANGSVFPVVQFLTKSAGFTGLVVGDSHHQGTSTTAQFTNFHFRSITQGLQGSPKMPPLGMVNSAAGGLSSSEFFARMNSVIAAVKPSYVILPGWTFNDDDGEVRADFPKIIRFLGRLLAAAETCRRLHAVPIFLTPFPRDAGNMGPIQLTAWTWLREQILSLEASGELVIDATKVLGSSTNGTYNGTYLAGMSTDGMHPNDAGHEAVAQLLRPTLAALVAVSV